MYCNPTYPYQKLQRNKQVAWVKSCAQWTHAVTITFPRSKLGVAPSARTACKATRHLVNALNRNLLGRGNVHKGHRIGSGFVFRTGPYGDHPHIHMALAAPSYLSYASMAKEIDHAIKCTRGLGRKFVIKSYNDSGWIDYMLDHCSDGFDIELISPTTPQQANSV